jgi:biphenyl 2,3-dioxygenase subunit beta
MSTIESAAAPGFSPRRIDVPIDDITEFLSYEAEVLDDPRRIREWCGLLTEDFTYQVPLRVRRNTQSASPAFPDGSMLIFEDRASIERRASRLETGIAYGEEPASLLRRIVGGVRAQPRSETEFDVRSAFLLYHNRSSIDGEIVAGERHDTLRFVGERILLAARVVHLDHLVIPTQNITYFL